MAIADNTTSLQALLEAINALPEAGSGEPASSETWTFTLSDGTTVTKEVYVNV